MGTDDSGEKFSIIFTELDRLSEEPDVILIKNEFIENEEIWLLGEIVREIQVPKMLYYTGT